MTAHPMNEETEQCPVCGQANNPGACETCPHYFGMYSEGEIIWSDRFDTFSEAWDHLSTTCSEFHDTHGCRPPKPIQKKYHAALNPISGFIPEDDSPSQALIGLLKFQSGPTIETDGMLSSSGHSLYLAKATELDQLIAQLEAIRLEVASLCTR
jgi:hypothetical protein